MVVSSVLRWKKTLIYAFFLLTILLLVSLIVLLQKVEEDTLPFNQHELNLLNANRFLSMDDVFKQSVPDITHIIYHQNSALPCNSKSPTILAFVNSAPAHFLHRKAIRNTWGSFSDGLSVRVIFVIGHSTQNLIWRKNIYEAKNYADILLVDMPDSYNNLTFKHIIGLHWALKNCPNVPYILKSDDDAFIDMYRIKNGILSNLPLNTIACRIVSAGSVPKRSGKWKVNRNDYPFDDYPEYCSGLVYFARPSTLKKILQSALSGQVPYLWIDDVFITGFAAEKAGIKRMDLSVWFAQTDEQILSWLKSDTTINSLPWMITEISPRYWPSEAVALWNKTIKIHKLKSRLRLSLNL